MTLLFLDTETGGLYDDTSILTITLTTYRFGTTRIFKVAELDLCCKPDDGVYRVEPEALGVNGINLMTHDRSAKTYTEAGRAIYTFLSEQMKGEKNRLVLCGQKVLGDLNRIFGAKIISEGTWDQFVDVRPIDTISIGKFACLCGLLPENQSLSVTNMAKALGIEVDKSKLHTSAYDNEVTAKILFALRDLFGTVR